MFELALVVLYITVRTGVVSTDLALDEVTDSGFGHDRDRNCSHDLLDHLWIGHSCNAALCSNICRNTLLLLARSRVEKLKVIANLQCHNCHGSGIFCYASLRRTHISYQFATARRLWKETNLLGIDNIHDDSALQHLCEAGLLDEGGGSIVAIGVLGGRGRHD